jgi:hypothetical protein
VVYPNNRILFSNKGNYTAWNNIIPYKRVSAKKLLEIIQKKKCQNIEHMLKERNKTQKATYYMTALLGNVQSRQIKSRNKK